MLLDHFLVADQERFVHKCNSVVFYIYSRKTVSVCPILTVLFSNDKTKSPFTHGKIFIPVNCSVKT